MDKAKSIAKGGWHPERTGSVRGDIRAMVGRGDKDIKGARERALAHHSAPLSSLKDPSTFEPPPKHAGYYGGEAGSESGASPVVSSSSSASRPVPTRPEAAETTESEEAPPSGPFRINTTGLSTANLPKPPVRRLNSPVGGSSMPRAATLPMSTNSAGVAAAKAKKPGPPLPPRLPPRENVAVAGPKVPAHPPPSYSQATTADTPATSKPVHRAGLLNQGAINRLGAAGVSVPGFDIGSQVHDSNGSGIQQQPPTTSEAQPAVNVAELQSRFAALGNAVSARVAEENVSGGPPVGKKPVCPPKPTFPAVSASASVTAEAADARKPPPIPLGTKPR